MSITNYPYPLAELIQFAEQCAKQYYTDGTELISDEEFDALKVQIVGLCKKHKINSNEIPIVVGVGYSRDDLMVKHVLRMYSLDNVYDNDGLRKFMMRVHQSVELTDPIRYGIEYKVDGMAISLTYRFGRLVSANTRGDGKNGENILSNILHVKSIPSQWSDFNVPLLVVHGELYVKKSEFKRYCEAIQFDLSQWRKADVQPKNCRSLVLSIRNSNFVNLGLQLSFSPYNVVASMVDSNEQAAIANIPEDLYSDSMFERLESLKEIGFDRIPPLSTPITVKSIGDSLVDIDQMYLTTQDKRNADEFDIPIDGLVLSVDQIEYREQLGHTERVPRFAMAYKFPALGQESKILSVAWQVTMNGHLIPVAQIHPVIFDGTEISKVNLHNYQSFHARDFHVRDEIIVVRKADVTPFISDILVDRRSPPSRSIEVPKLCPSCSTSLVKTNVHLKCPNAHKCPDQIIARMMYFCKGSSMSVAALGPKLCVTLYSQGKLNSYPDLYKLKSKKHKGSKQWQKLLDQIELSKSRDFLHVLGAINAPRPKGGYVKIALKYKTLEQWIDDVVIHQNDHDDVTVEFIKRQYPELKELCSFGIGNNNESHSDE